MHYFEPLRKNFELILYTNCSMNTVQLCTTVGVNQEVCLCCGCSKKLSRIRIYNEVRSKNTNFCTSLSNTWLLVITVLLIINQPVKKLAISQKWIKREKKSKQKPQTEKNGLKKLGFETNNGLVFALRFPLLSMALICKLVVNRLGTS